ncbi:antitoxin [Streptomyces sp. NPDC029721]|uniref:antitoxin n=1 Tax=Streptomyces sp. NPDC029721 TaxID=3157090 RepID=UPI0033E43D59
MFDALKNLKDKAEEIAQSHGGAIAAGLEKVGDIVDQKTDGKHSVTIDTAVDEAQDLMENLAKKKD